MSVYVLVSGDFTPWGGMDRANYELAWHLAERVCTSVHLVSHRVVPPLVEHPRVSWHRVPKPLNSYTLSAPLLALAGRRVARCLSRQDARVIVNGGNCRWPDVNWVHAVHAVWENRNTHASALFRLRNRWLKYRARRAEKLALQEALVIVANSERTRQQIIEKIGVPAERVHVVYLGVDANVFRLFSDAERAAARYRLGRPANRPLAVFTGALGRDRNKGFDVLFAAWNQLCRDSRWDVDLVVAGAGAEVKLWQQRASAAGLSERIYMRGFTTQVPDLLAAADVLVSPTFYDAYGLAVQEALCCGLPAFVTRSAGIAERFPAEMADCLLPDPPDAGTLAHCLRRWRQEMPAYRARASCFGAMLRQRTWSDMAAQMVSIIKETG
ncbi:MAG TPA: glycosyltransferase family 4 protein [Gemmataceae bacterium]|jgi:glycosyltransferase involved in cell wall biosynthesis